MMVEEKVQNSGGRLFQRCDEVLDMAWLENLRWVVERVAIPVAA